VCGLGDNTVDRYVHAATMYPGGNAVNVAVYARRDGADTGYLGAVGDDSGGDLIADSLRREGVDVTRLRRRPGPTSWTEVRIEDGDRRFGEHLVGVSRFALEADDLDYLAGFDVVHLGDSSGLEEQLPELARRCRVSFDFSDRPRAYAEPLLAYVDVATFSAAGLTEDDVTELITWAHARGARHVAVTRGAAGAVVSDGRTAHGAAPAGGPVRDTLGAGDAFIAGHLLAVLAGEPPRRAVAAALRTAARACGTDGAFGHGVADTTGPAPADLGPSLRTEGGAT
jgi:fructoselysine 6-kinase